MTRQYIFAIINGMARQLDKNPEIIASGPISERAEKAVQLLIILLRESENLEVLNFILRNAHYPIEVLCAWGEQGLIFKDPTNTLSLFSGREVPHSAGVYVWTVERIEIINALNNSFNLQYVGSTYYHPQRYYEHAKLLLRKQDFKGNSSGLYKYVRENSLQRLCKWNAAYKTFNFTREFMLAFPHLRLSPLDLLTLNSATELLPRILEQSLLSAGNFGFNSKKKVDFSFKLSQSYRWQFVLVDPVTKEQISPPLCTKRQLGHLLNIQNSYDIQVRIEQGRSVYSPVYQKTVKISNYIANKHFIQHPKSPTPSP